MARKRVQKSHYRGLNFNAVKFRAHVTAIGQVILIWNDLHEQLALIYWTLKRYDDSAMNEWNSARLDRKKRDLIRAWSKDVPTQHYAMAPEIYDDIDWLIREINGIAEQRNDTAHAPLTFTEETFLSSKNNFTAGVVSNTRWNNERAQNLSRKNLLAEFRWCRKALTKLRDYAIAIERGLSNGEYDPWPNKPLWPIPRPKSKPVSHSRPPRTKFRGLLH